MKTKNDRVRAADWRQIGIAVSVLCIVYALLILSGCVRLTGSAGYSATRDGETNYKNANFDTNRVTMGGNA